MKVSVEAHRFEQNMEKTGRFSVFLRGILYIIGGFMSANRFRWGYRAQVGDGRVGQRMGVWTNPPAYTETTL